MIVFGRLYDWLFLNRQRWIKIFFPERFNCLIEYCSLIWLTDWLIDFFSVQKFDWILWFCLINWLIDWLIDLFLYRQLIEYCSFFINWLIDWFFFCTDVWLKIVAFLLIDQLIDWLIDWLIDSVQTSSGDTATVHRRAEDVPLSGRARSEGRLPADAYIWRR